MVECPGARPVAEHLRAVRRRPPPLHELGGQYAGSQGVPIASLEIPIVGPEDRADRGLGGPGRFPGVLGQDTRGRGARKCGSPLP